MLYRLQYWNSPLAPYEKQQTPTILGDRLELEEAELIADKHVADSGAVWREGWTAHTKNGQQYYIRPFDQHEDIRVMVIVPGRVGGLA